MSRYSQLYIDQSAPLPDSARARHRLGKLMQGMLGTDEARALGHLLERELGVSAGVSFAYDFPTFCAKCAIRDFLDTVTITRTYLGKQGTAVTGWVTEARRMFSEERLAYEIDEKGIVHPAVDKEFQRNRHGSRTSTASLCK